MSDKYSKISLWLKKSVANLTKSDLEGKRVLMRVDFNVPMDNGAITDDTRIKAALPTINDLISKGAKVILCSHMGRPKGQVKDSLRLTPVAVRLSELLGKNVVKCDDCIGDDVTNAVNGMANGDVVLLENLRFYNEEEANDPEFAKKIS